PIHAHARTIARVLLSPALLTSLPAAMPLFSNARDNIVGMGLDERRLFEAMARFEQVGDRAPAVRRNPSYLALKEFGKMVANRSHPYHMVADTVSGIVEHYPRWLLKKPPSWVDQLTFRPVV